MSPIFWRDVCEKLESNGETHRMAVFGAQGNAEQNRDLIFPAPGVSVIKAEMPLWVLRTSAEVLWRYGQEEGFPAPW